MNTGTVMILYWLVVVCSSLGSYCQRWIPLRPTTLPMDGALAM